MRPEKLDRRTIREQIADYYIDYIRSGYIAVGDQLPSRAEVVMIWDVSARQAQQALLLLCQRGYAVSRRGGATRAAVPDLGTA